MDKREERLFKLEVRLAATEYLVANMYAAVFGQRPDAEREMKRANDILRDNLRIQTVPCVDAVWSDHVTAEMQDAMEHVLAIMEDMVSTTAQAARAQAARDHEIAGH
jgi:hypothetical protein